MFAGYRDEEIAQAAAAVKQAQAACDYAQNFATAKVTVEKFISQMIWKIPLLARPGGAGHAEPAQDNEASTVP